MKIIIKNGIPIGTLKINGKNFRGNYAVTILEYLSIVLYDLEIWTWYDFVLDILLIKMQGSIISMMQFEKYLDFNFPTAIIK